jgi:hypothetical protein
MIDPKLCFSATNEIVKIAKAIAESYKYEDKHETKVELTLSIYEELNDIANSCSSDVREGYTQHIAKRFPEWIRDEAYKIIRLREISGTLVKMRESVQSQSQSTPPVNN